MKFTFQIYQSGLEGANAPCKNLNTSDFNEIRIILLMFTGSVYQFDYWQLG